MRKFKKGDVVMVVDDDNTDNFDGLPLCDFGVRNGDVGCVTGSQEHPDDGGGLVVWVDFEIWPQYCYPNELIYIGRI